MRDFLKGISYLPRGFRLLWVPGLRPFVIVPILINVVVFSLLLWGGAEAFQGLMEWLLPDPAQITGSGWWAATKRFLTEAAYWLLWPVFLLVAAVLVFYGFTIVANLIGSPFNGTLAARVEAMTSGQAPPPSNNGPVQEVALAVGGELRKYAYLLKLLIPLCILSLIPVLNFFAAPLWALFGAWALSLEYMDYPMANHGMRLKEERELLAKRRALALGFGFGVMAMTLVPVLNLLAMPTAVIAATLLWLGEFRGAAAAKV